MCELCDGADFDDVCSKMYRLISTHGFTVVPVGSSGTVRGWAYTIGLIDNFDHPELVIAGLPLDEAARTLLALGSCVSTGDSLAVPGGHSLNGEPIGVRPVHPRHLRDGLMNFWTGYYDWLVRSDIELSALQIVMPANGYCWGHQKEQPDLSSPAHVPFDGSRRRRRPHRPSAAVAPSSERPRRSAPPATMRDVRRHRRTARRRR